MRLQLLIQRINTDYLELLREEIGNFFFPNESFFYSLDKFLQFRKALASSAKSLLNMDDQELDRALRAQEREQNYSQMF